MTWAHKARGSEGGEPDETGFPREGYQLGDLAGAVSLAIPMEVYEAEARERTMANVSLFGALAAVIVAVAVAVNGALRRQGRQMDTLDAASLEADRYRVEILPSMCSTWRMRWRRPLRLTVALTAAAMACSSRWPTPVLAFPRTSSPPFQNASARRTRPSRGATAAAAWDLRS